MAFGLRRTSLVIPTDDGMNRVCGAKYLRCHYHPDERLLRKIDMGAGVGFTR